VYSALSKRPTYFIFLVLIHGKVWGEKRGKNLFSLYGPDAKRGNRPSVLPYFQLQQMCLDCQTRFRKMCFRRKKRSIRTCFPREILFSSLMRLLLSLTTLLDGFFSSAFLPLLISKKAFRPFLASALNWTRQLWPFLFLSSFLRSIHFLRDENVISR